MVYLRDCSLIFQVLRDPGHLFITSYECYQIIAQSTFKISYDLQCGQIPDEIDLQEEGFLSICVWTEV